MKKSRVGATLLTFAEAEAVSEAVGRVADRGLGNVAGAVAAAIRTRGDVRGKIKVAAAAGGNAAVLATAGDGAQASLGDSPEDSTVVRGFLKGAGVQWRVGTPLTGGLQGVSEYIGRAVRETWECNIDKAYFREETSTVRGCVVAVDFGRIPIFNLDTGIIKTHTYEYSATPCAQTGDRVERTCRSKDYGAKILGVGGSIIRKSEISTAIHCRTGQVERTYASTYNYPKEFIVAAIFATPVLFAMIFARPVLFAIIFACVVLFATIGSYAVIFAIVFFSTSPLCPEFALCSSAICLGVSTEECWHLHRSDGVVH